VESRLRSVRLQANKARRYREYLGRLQELRTQVAQVDWRRLTEKLAGVESELAVLREQRDAAAAEAESLEARLLEVEGQIGELTESVRQSEAKAAANRERIAAAESTIEHERARSRDLEGEIAHRRRQLVAMGVRAGGLQQQLLQTGEAVRAADDEQRQIARRLGEQERCLTELITRLDQLRGESHDRRSACLEQMRAAAALGNQTSALESGAAAALAAKQRCRHRLDELDAQLRLLDDEREALDRRREELAKAVEDRREHREAAQSRLAERRQQRERRHAELIQLQQRHGAMAERVAVLEELESRFEGLSSGVKEVLTLARSAEEGPFRQVRGLVADLLRVSVEAAPLVEVALGEAAQHVVVAAGRPLIEHLQAEPYQFSGRVGFVPLVDLGAVPDRLETDLEGHDGVLGRADRFVETEPPYEALARRLLGRTWIVEKLAHAVALASGPGAGCSFVTLAGEMLAADGTLTVGPRHPSSGLISRRSELRVLRSQLTELETSAEQVQSAVLRLDQQIAQDQGHLDALATEHQQAAEALGEHGHRITAAGERRVQLTRQREALDAEFASAARQHDAALEALDDTRSRQRQLEAELADMEAGLAGLAQQIERLEAERQAQGRQTTEAKVELAKSDERLRNLRARMHQFEENRQERQRAIAEGREELAQCLRRAEQARWSILRAESDIAELYLHKEAFTAHSVELIDQREGLQAQRTALAAEVQRGRTKVRKLDEKIHAKELVANEVRMERSALADRFREDYQIELAELEHAPTDEEQRQRAEVQQEIDELRQKINALGNVNLEALEEIEQLEARHANLSGQHKDLADAKASLERIIERINADSRRLFLDTLQTVRGHFEKLFRDLFGGGQADIVLEEGLDVLEGGIEIVARPPGKEPRSISLLSGGEKTLTCVALLLAIFRSRPSPFCVLDEVDAALDEANIDRFTGVLREFLAWTQFIIVTHSKRTMTCADTIYGVTMQESGISKQVSVRFEDVSDTGEIQLPADRAGQPLVGGDEPSELDAGETQAA
jgi:chromosome segregation protein